MRQEPAPVLRADARRNTAQIREAALSVFRDRGLSVPLEEVAAAAGVSKATIFNRFGGRVGLIETVVDQIVAVEMDRIVAHTRSLPEPRERIVHYVTAMRDLQYDRPAANDVLLQAYPHSAQLMDICRAAGEMNAELIADGRAAGALHPQVGEADLHALVVDNALALKHGARPERADYDRRTGFVLHGICSD
ncbi:TetR/AcrR family transcriptional regulator [Demetria terragena]|uniref:TetR/AcrR family transcriptional regulator n=1 Tax=Demetria terragena TaxID=63959 RepID=UPI00036B0C03|nr:TetR/AcrR family transcriptional regulator [Demetria terragena]